MMRSLKLVLFVVVVGVFSVGCAETDDYESSLVSEAQAQQSEKRAPAEAAKIVLVELVEKDTAGSVAVWTIRWQDPWLVLFKNDVEVKRITPEVWFAKVEAVADPDQKLDLDKKLVAIEHEIAFWQDVKDSALVHIASPDRAQERIEQKQIERKDIVESVLYQKAKRYSEAFATLRQAVEGSPTGPLKLTAPETASDEMMSLIFAPFRQKRRLFLR